MTKTKAWISAFRLRTLPLALSCVIMGGVTAFVDGSFSKTLFGLTALTTILLQVLSNLANDYGDGIKGTDNEDRLGPDRAIQSGTITPSEMKKGLIVNVALTLISGISLIWLAFQDYNLWYVFGFFILGLLSIAAAIKYTMGSNAYGYHGMGDLFVFLFFGIIGVFGTNFLMTHEVNWINIFPSICIGALSSAVLNMNNMRDIDNDRKHGKNTLVVKIGAPKSRIYHSFLLIIGLTSLVTYLLLIDLLPIGFIALIPAPILILNLKKVWSYEDPQSLDPELKKIALSTFGLSLLLGIAIVIQLSLQ